MDMSKRFWVDSKMLLLDKTIDVEYKLTQMRYMENSPGVFEVDIDRVDDPEEVLG
jgi:hypothetical protein